MDQILVFGNSASGKSTLAKHVQASEGLAHLDLDTVAWLPAQGASAPERQPLADSMRSINEFCDVEPNWLIEGCYADLLGLLAERASMMIFLNLPIESCIENAKQRLWEPHKYSSKAEQDANLPMLIDWIAGYETRDDTFSKSAHQRLFDDHAGVKKMFTSTPDLRNFSVSLELETNIK